MPIRTGLRFIIVGRHALATLPALGPSGRLASRRDAPPSPALRRALISFQAHQRVALDVGSVLQRSVSSRNRFVTGPWEPGPIPVIVGATWTPAHYFDARAQLSFENVLGVYSAPLGDHLTLGFYVSFRG